MASSFQCFKNSIGGKMDGEIEVIGVPINNEVFLKRVPRTLLLSSTNCHCILSAMVATGIDTRVLVGTLDKENIFREYQGKNLPELISSLVDDGNVCAVEVPREESPLHFDILVSVGLPQLKQAVTWLPDALRAPKVLRLLRLTNYDSMYERVRQALHDACPFLPDYDEAEPKGLPWWVWTEEQDTQEREVRAAWAGQDIRYPEVTKGQNTNCNWVWGKKHYFFRLYKLGHPEQHLMNDGLPSPDWGHGVHHLILEYHPLYARKVFKHYK